MRTAAPTDLLRVGDLFRSRRSIAAIATAAAMLSGGRVHAQVGARAVLSSLSAEDTVALFRGNTVIAPRAPGDSSWRVTVYRYVAAPPREVAAVFFDFESHTALKIPFLKEARVTMTADPSTRDVDYALSGRAYLVVPINVKYKVRDSLSRDETGNDYVVAWRGLESESLDSVSGSARFLSLDSSGTRCLFRYEAFARPKSGFANAPIISGFVKSNAESGARETVERIASAGEHIHDDPDRYRERMSRITAAVGAP